MNIEKTFKNKLKRDRKGREKEYINLKSFNLD